MSVDSPAGNETIKGSPAEVILYYDEGLLGSSGDAEPFHSGISALNVLPLASVSFLLAASSTATFF